MRHLFSSLASLTIAAIATAALAFATTAAADDGDSDGKFHAHNPTDIWDIARGAQLYDNWMAATDADEPKGTHPAYPAVGKKKGKTTWRCKECHGWDGLGKDGAYSKGSHFTGIRGIRAMIGVPVEKIHKVIMNKTHGYNTRMISHSAMEKLALFISRGQITMDKYIDRQTKKPLNANIDRGASFYQTICANCHGFDGKEINFKTPPKAEFVGTVASDNPWELLFKIRHGQPGAPMPGLIMLPMKDLVDILAYTQTLPAK